MQQRGEVAIGGALKRVELAGQALRRRPRPRRADTLRSVDALAAAPRAPEVAVLREIDDARLPPVRIGRVEPLGRLDVVAQLADEARVVEQRIARRRGLRRQRRQLVHARSATRASSASRSNGSRRHAPSKSRHSASSRAARRIRSTGPSSLSRPSRDQTLRRSARRTPSGGCSSCSCSHDAERLVEDPFGARLGQHLEQRDRCTLRPAARAAGRRRSRESC